MVLGKIKNTNATLTFLKYTILCLRTRRRKQIEEVEVLLVFFFEILIVVNVRLQLKTALST